MRFARPIATLLLAVGVATCSDTPIAPVRTGATPSLKPGVGRLALAPAFSRTAQYVAQHAAAFPAVQFDSVHIVIRGTPDTTTIVKDTTIFFDPNTPSITLNLDVPVSSDGQRFNAAMAYKGPSGVVYSGSVVVQSHAPDQPAQPATITVNYVGPGSRVKAIVVTPKSVTLNGTGSTAFSVSAIDSTNAATTVPPLAWATSDGSVASVSASGLVTAQNKRGSATITASTPTGLSDNASVSVTLPPAGIAVISGGGQSGKVGAALPNPAVVQVSAADGVGVAGVSVIFSAPAGGSVSPTTATTDGSGRASASMKLGNAVGPQGFAATAAGFSTAIGATATAGDPAAIALVSGSGQSDTVGHALKAPLVVKVSDAFGNPVAGATVAWARTAGSGALGSASSSTNSDGLATNSYTLGTSVGAEGASASVAGQSVSFGFTALAAGAAKIGLVSGNNQTGRVGTVFDAPFIVQVTDIAGNAVSGATVSWAATNGTIAATSTSGANGQASATMTGGTVLGAASATASIANGQSVSFAATLQAGFAAKLVFLASPASGVPNQALSPVQVALRDAGGNATGANLPVTVALGANTAGATLSGTVTRNAVNGIATFDDLKLDKVGTGFTLVATSGTLTSVTSGAFATAVGTATQLTFVPSGPTTLTVTAGQSITLPQVKVSDANGNGVAGIVVHGVIDTSSQHVKRDSSDFVSDASGLVTIPNQQPEIAGVYRATFTSPSIPGVAIAINATVNPGAATQVVFANKNSLARTATSGVALSPQPTVRVADAFGNAVPGTAVPITIAAVPLTGATVTGGTGTIPSSSGQLTLSNVVLTGSGSVRLVVSAPNTTLASDTSFVIGVGGGAATQLVRTSGFSSYKYTAGSPPSTFPVVQARNVSNVGVANVPVRFTFNNSSNFRDTVTDANGFATFPSGYLSTSTAGVYTITATSTAIANANVTITDTVVAGAATKLSFANRSALPTSLTSGATISPAPTVQALDNFGNVASGSLPSIVLSAFPASGFTLNGAGPITPTNGQATFTGVTIAGTGTTKLVANASNSSLTPDSSNTITVSAGTPASLALINASSPMNVTAGQVQTSLPGVVVRDASNSGVAGVAIHIVATKGSQVLLTTDTTTGTGGVLTFPTSVTSPHLVGTYVITATSSNAGISNQSVSLTINVSAAAASQLAFTTSPPTAVSGGITLSPAVVVAVQDQYGNAATTATDSITLTLSPSATILGTYGKHATAGTASFSNLSVATAGTYTMTASAAGLTSATTTSSMVVTASSLSAATRTQFIQTIAQSLLDSMPVIKAAGSGGAGVSNVPVLFSVTSGSCKVNGTNTSATVSTDASGKAALSSVTLPLTAGSCTVRATSSGIGSTINFTIVDAPLNTTKVWLGSTSDDFTDVNNWRTLPSTNAPAVPGSTDHVYVPANAFTTLKVRAATAIGAVASEAGSTVDFNSGTFTLTVGGDIDVAGTLTNASNATVLVDAPGATNLRVASGPWTLAVGDASGVCQSGTSAYTQTGDITATVLRVRCPLTVNGHNETIANLYTETSNGVLVMTNSADHVVATGDVGFGGGSETNKMTAGLLELSTYFSEGGASTSAFAPSGTHKTRFVGTGSQQVGFADPTTSFFNNLEITNHAANGFLMTSNVLVNGDLTVTNGVVAGSDRTMTVNGKVVADASSDLSSVNTLISKGSTFPSFGGSAPQTVSLSGTASLSMSSSQTFTGNLNIEQPVSVGANVLTVQGDVTVGGSNGQLNLANAASSVVSSGSVTYGANVGSTISAGSIEVKGTSFTIDEGASTPTTFTGGTLKFSGSSQQATLRNSSMSRLYDLVVTNGATVGFQTDATAVHSVDVSGSGSALNMYDGSPNELLTLLSGATMKLHAGTAIRGDLTVNAGATCSYDTSVSFLNVNLTGTCTQGSVP